MSQLSDTKKTGAQVSPSFLSKRFTMCFSFDHYIGQESIIRTLKCRRGAERGEIPRAEKPNSTSAPDAPAAVTSLKRIHFLDTGHLRIHDLASMKMSPLSRKITVTPLIVTGVSL